MGIKILETRINSKNLGFFIDCRQLTTNITEGKKVITTALLFSEVTNTFTTKPIIKENAISLITITLPTPDLLK